MTGRHIFRITSRISLNILIAAFSVTCVFPVIWMLYSSLKTKQEFAMSILALPKSPQFGNYIRAFQVGEMHIYLLNSVIISSLTVAVLLAVSFTAAYALARFSFRLNPVLYIMFITGILIPIHGLMVPVFIMFNRIHITDTRLSLVLVYVGFGLPLTIFLLQAFIRSIPREMEEAAFMDGGTLYATLREVILPMSTPAIATSMILAFLNAWNEFPFALVLIRSKALKTLPLGLTNFSGQFNTDYTKLMAALLIALIPIMLVYFVSYKAIMRGMLAGAVKG
ncbi:MAG TPA: carbohydrate ABC transporter permease [Spirochaetia bacterium]|nr:carbohydrate ABC transporter permease [Spirochaetia bacterium]